jgi:hypothetical protein
MFLQISPIPSVSLVHLPCELQAAAPLHLLSAAYPLCISQARLPSSLEDRRPSSCVLHLWRHPL